MHLRKLWLLAGAVFAGLVLVATGSARQTSPKAAGTMVIGLEQEPTILNTSIIGGDALANVYIAVPMWSGAYKILPNFAFKPELVSSVLVQKNPFRLTYHIKKNAFWNDGGKKVPVTAQDFVFTWKVVMNPKIQVLGTTGFDQIQSAKIINKKTVKFTFKTPFAGWKLLFPDNEGVLPSFALKNDESFNKTWLNFVGDPRTNKPISMGPFIMTGPGDWIHGRQLTLVRNPLWWQGKAKLSKLVFRFFPDSQTEAQQIKSGELDAFNPQPQVFLVPLRHTAGLKTQIGRGPVFEHIDFNVGFHNDNPLLKQLYFRQAFAAAINRKQIVDALFTKTDIAPGLPVLNNVWIFQGSPFYKQPWAFVKPNAAKAISIMKSHGCTGGPSRPGAGGIWTCNGTKASFRFAWRSGNQLRVLTFEALQSQLKAAGIEIKADDSANLFSSRLPKGDFDIVLFAWQGSPDLSGLNNIYGCRDDQANKNQQNDQGYCNQKVTRLLDQVNRTFDPKVQAGIFNKATAQIAKDLVTIPLYQKPTYLIYKSRFKNVKENPTSETFVWNIGRVTG
jgi:peptide/nickel transport system substrate-binding protein